MSRCTQYAWTLVALVLLVVLGLAWVDSWVTLSDVSSVMGERP